MAHPYLLGSGGVLIILGVLLYRWASRYDLKGMALDAAWQVAKNRGRLDVETDLGNRLNELQAEGSNVERAKMVASHAARHVAAQAMNVAALICFAAGALLIAIAVWWK
jgi:hypothetical protein